jgi:4-hydroxybenzoate polyprenyltransferase
MRHLRVVHPEPAAQVEHVDAVSARNGLAGVGDFFALIRPAHWVKNLLILTPPFFAGQMFSVTALALAVPVLVAFCCAASAGYAINDIVDSGKDRLHPRKRNRPIASGRLAAGSATFVAVALLVASFVIALTVTASFSMWLAAYVVTSAGYTFVVKRVFLLDTFAIAACFVIRVMAGGSAFGVSISSWLFLTMFFLSLFLAVGKRLGERRLLGEAASLHRRNLTTATEGFLRAGLWAMAIVTLVTYALYTVEVRNSLFYTVPFATYGVLRYLFLIEERGAGDPTDLVLHDLPLLGLLGLWAVVVGAFIYASS